MTSNILKSLIDMLAQVEVELKGKKHSDYDEGYIDGILRACEAVNKVIKETEAPCTK